MTNRNVPDGDSVELYFALPSTRIPAVTTFVVEANYLGTNVVIPASHLFYAINEGAFTALVGGKFNVPAGAHHFYICARLNVVSALIYGDKIEVKVTPQNNKDWFEDEFYIVTAGVSNRKVTSALTIPSVVSTEEGQEGLVQATILPALEGPANFNVKVTHITTNSTVLDGLQVSTNNAVSWTNLLNNINFVLPAGSTGFLIKYTIKPNQVEDGTRYFDITTVETTPVKLIKPIVNVKTRVTVIDMTHLNYGDLISTYCKIHDLVGIYSDGNGGRYEEPIIFNAATCGSVIVPPDTVLLTFCAGTTRIQHLSDGAGGYYRNVLDYNSVACGYTEASPVNPNTDVTPTSFNQTRKGGTVILNPEGDTFGAMLRDNAISLYSTRFGKWYFEVKVYIPTTAHLEVGLGFGTTALNMAEYIGANQYTWSWWPYDSTKYHSDVQDIYAQTLDVVNNDIIGVLLDMDNNRFGFNINDVFQGWIYEDLSDEKMHFLLAGRIDSWAFVNFGKFAFKFDVPGGYYAGFGTITNPPEEKDVVVSSFCSGVDKWVKKSDGKGATYDELLSIDSLECGWVNPVPPAGTILGFVCDGFSKFNKLADGVGGFTLSLSQLNSTQCGYIPPIEGGFSNVFIYNADGYIDPAVGVSGDLLSFTNLTQSVETNYGNLSGIWFWELINWTGAYYVGFQNRDSLNINDSVWDDNGIGIDLGTGMVNNRGTKEVLFSPIPPGTPIGFKIDFKEQTITCYVESQLVVISTALNYPLVSASRFYPSVTAKTPGSGIGTFNFGQAGFHFSAAVGLNAYQEPVSAFYQRGTPLSYQCDVWTRYISRADGNDGSFTEVYENDSATCGWYPDPEVGTVLGYYCLGYDRYKTVANGNYTTINVLIEANSLECGYIPYGVTVSLFCKNKDQWALKSDGNDGTYEELVKLNSLSCGFIESEGNMSDQEPDPRFNLSHQKSLPVIGYDITHSKVFPP